jgi:hypothetical protein
VPFELVGSGKELGQNSHNSLGINGNGPSREDLQVGAQLFCPGLCYPGRVPLVPPVADNEDLGGQLVAPDACS